MTNYVLEILDGDQAGTTLQLTSGKLKMGRRPDNDLVLRDEKCSGHHAEIEYEAGSYVLRDLGSTNGSLIDGRKITEVALSNMDIFQLGRVLIRFQAEGAAESVEDMQISRLDRASLGKRRALGLGSLLLILLLVAGGGTLAWLEFLSPQGSSLAGQRERPVLRVPGNLLSAESSNIEGDIPGWDLQVGGLSFEAGFGRRDARSGSGYLEARRGEGESSYALAGLSEPVSILAGTPVRVQGYLRSEEGAEAAIRVVFSSSRDNPSDGGAVLRTGSKPQSYAAYQAVEIIETVPQGMDLVTIELLAILPAAESAVYCDDLALISDRSLSVSSTDMSCRDGRSLRGTGESFIVIGQDASLLGIRPAVESGAWSELAADGFLVPSDLGLSFAVEAVDKIGFRFSPRADEPIDGLVLRFPSNSRPCLTVGANGEFEAQEGDFTAVKSSAVMLGHGPDRLLLEFAEPVEMSAKLELEGYDLGLAGTAEGGVADFELRLVFDAAASQARDLLRQARDARSDGGMRLALEFLQDARGKFPHDEGVSRQVEELRREIMGEMEQRIANLREGAADAAFFRSESGYRRIRDEVVELIDRYGAENVYQVESLQKLGQDMESGLQLLDSIAGSEHSSRLQLLEGAFRDSGAEDLAKLVKDYLQRHHGGGK